MARSEMAPGVLLQQLRHEQQNRLDIVLNTQNNVRLVEGGGLVQLSLDAPGIPEADGLVLPINRWAHKQIAERSMIPWRYYERMLDGNGSKSMSGQPELLLRNVHTWWAAEPEDRLVRAFLPNGGPGKVRAWLSDSYRLLDNQDFVTTVLEAADEVGGIRVHSCHIDDERLYLQIVSENMAADYVRPGAHSRINQPIQLGITVRNSEVGDGAVVVQPWMLILACDNGATIHRNLGAESAGGFRRTHLGKGYEKGIISHETLNLENAAVWSLVRDWVRNAMSPEHLNRVLAQLHRADATPTLAKPRPAVGNVVRRMGLTPTEGNALLERYLVDAHVNGTSQYGMFQALTQVAHEVDSGYRRQVELEEAGGRMLELEGRKYEAMVTAPIDDEALAGAFGVN